MRAIDVTDSLPREIKHLIDGSVESALPQIGEEEFFYIGRNFERKAEAVQMSRIPWVRDLAREMQVLHELYRSYTDGERDLSESAVAWIGATLFYFVNPYDIIPDHVPGRGYLDDAYVLNRCVHELKKLAPDCVASGECL